MSWLVSAILNWLAQFFAKQIRDEVLTAHDRQENASVKAEVTDAQTLYEAQEAINRASRDLGS